MSKYLLIESYDNEIYVEKFDTYEEAKATIVSTIRESYENEFRYYNDYASWEELEINYQDYDFDYYDFRFSFHGADAWLRDGDCNLDWKIVEI